jgi:hypothetical protein
MATTRHTAKGSESLDAIAAHHGFASASPLTDLPENRALLHRRGRTLAAGDTLAIPEKKEKQADVKAGATNAFVAKVPSLCLRLRLLGDDLGPLRLEQVFLDQGGTRVEGRVLRDGWIEVDVRRPLQQPKGRIVALLADAPEGPRYEWEVRLDGLHEAMSSQGLLERLSNAGLAAPDTRPGEVTMSGLLALAKEADLQAPPQAEQLQIAALERNGT